MADLDYNINLNLLKKITQEELDEKIENHFIWSDSLGDESEQAILNFYDLSGLDLSKISLNFISMVGSNFKDADLSGSTFSLCKMAYANFQDANLEKTNFKDSYLHYASFEGANMYLTSINSVLNNNIFENIESEKSVSGRDADDDYFLAHDPSDLGKITQEELDIKLIKHDEWCNSAGVQGEFADLSNLDLEGLTIKPKILTNIPFSNSSFKNVDLCGKSFFYCNMRACNLEGANLEHSVMDNTLLTGANLKNSSLFNSFILYPHIKYGTILNNINSKKSWFD